MQYLKSQLGVWLAVAGWPAGWQAGWLSGWLAGLLADWMAAIDVERFVLLQFTKLHIWNICTFTLSRMLCFDLPFLVSSTQGSDCSFMARHAVVCYEMAWHAMLWRGMAASTPLGFEV